MIRALRGSTPYVLLTPAFLCLVLFVVGPLLFVVVLSFFNVDLLRNATSFVGVDNYATELTSTEFAQSLRNTLLYAAYTIPTSMTLGLLVALAINRVRWGKGMWQSIYFLPAASTLVAMSSVWRWMFQPDAGIVDRILEPIFGVTDWLNAPALALGAVAIVGVWHQIGFVAILFLAALGTLPQAEYDSATLDGAGAWNQFWHVTWPALGPTTIFALALTCSAVLQAYDSIVALTGGGPANATEMLTFAIWNRGIQFFDVGRAAVLSVVLLCLSGLVTVVQRSRYGRRLEAAGTR